MDVAQVVFIGLGVWVALQGLQTWRLQLKGSVEYEVAQNTLRCAYKTRQALEFLRDPFRWLNVSLTDTPQEKFNTERKDWNKRIDKFTEAYDELCVQQLESEIVFGDKVISSYVKELRDIFIDIRGELEGYLQHLDPHNCYMKDDEDLPNQGTEQARRRNIVYRCSSHDPIDAHIADILEKIENYLKPYLHRK